MIMAKKINDQAKGNLKIVGIAVAVLVALSCVVGFFLFGNEKKQQVVIPQTSTGVGGVTDQGQQAFQNEAYNQKIDQMNEQKAKEAAASGGSAVPTLQPPGEQGKRERDDSISADPFPEKKGRQEGTERAGGRKREDGSYDVPPPPGGDAGNESYVYGQDGRQGDSRGQGGRVSSSLQELNQSLSLPSQAIAFAGGKDGGQQTAASGSAQTQKTTPTPPQATALIEKGTMCYAVVESHINSDEAKAMVSGTLASCQGVNGKSFNGARIFGNIERSGESVVVKFTTMNAAKKGYTIDAVAFDEQTGRGALSGEVDRHTFVRYWLPAITEIMAGWGAASSRDNTSTTINIGSTTTTQGELSDKSKFAMAIGKSGETVNKIVQDAYKGKEVTVQIPKGVGVGVLFLGDVTSPAGGV